MMHDPQHAIRALAHSVLRDAVAAGSPALAAAFEHRCAQLRGRLVILIGPLGFAALAGRALHLAQVDHPALDAITLESAARAVDGTGGLRGVQAFAADRTPDEVAAALTATLVAFGGLLDSFIGADLALRLLREAWATAPADDAAAQETEAAR